MGTDRTRQGRDEKWDETSGLSGWLLTLLINKWFTINIRLVVQLVEYNAVVHATHCKAVVFCNRETARSCQDARTETENRR